MSRLLLLLLTLAVPAGLAGGATRPNLLFLFADDYTFDALRALGELDVDTPNLDRLAARGTTFTHAYNMGGWQGAVCVSSRTMLVTGRSLWRAQAVYDQTDREREAGRLWPQLLAAQGYATYFTGKWHIKTAPELTFHTARHVRPGMPKDTPSAYDRPHAGKPDPWNAADPALGGFWEGGKHWSEVTADDAIDYLADRGRGAKPFFLYVAFNAPHDPRQSPQEYLDRYPLERIRTPASFQPEYPFKDLIGCGPKLRDEHLAPFPRTEFAVKTHRREYFALITHLDAQIGRVLAALDRSGDAAQTWIFFTADHGLAIGRHGLLGKQNVYDHSLRVPFIVAGPGVAANRRIEAPIYLQDVMPTTLELAGLERPDQVDFRSFLPLLRDARARPARDTVYAAYIDLQRAVIHDGWKLIVYPKARVARLYHLARDPQELRDLAGDPQQTARKRELFQRLLAEQRLHGDPLDLGGTFAELARR